MSDGAAQAEGGETMSELYDAIYKRKSVRKFSKTLDEDALFAVRRHREGLSRF